MERDVGKMEKADKTCHSKEQSSAKSQASLIKSLYPSLLIEVS